MSLTIWAGVVVLFVLLHRFIYERLRLIWYVDKLEGPAAIPLAGCTWQMKWKINELSLQLFEWMVYYRTKKVELLRFWLGPFPMVVLHSANAVKAILESQTVLKKGPEYNIVERWLGQGLLISTGDKWRLRRKQLTPAFHFNVLNRFQTTHDKEAQILIEQLEPFADSGEKFDMYPFIKRCALDIICETSMGVKVSAQTQHKHPYVVAVKRMNELSFTYQRMPWLWFKPIWYALGYGREYDARLKQVTDFTRKVIADRRQTFEPINLNESAIDDERISSGKRRYAFLDLLLSLQHDGGDLTDEDIRSEVDTFMFEGHDTTGAALAWALWLLAHNVDCQEQIFNEVDRVFGNSNRDCTSDDIKELRYVEMCIKETLRMFPPVPFYSRRANEDVECVGYKIPRGCTILIAPNALHLDPVHFPNPEKFIPERFTPEASSKRHPYSYIPFSAGPRNCIGQKFALAEEKTILSWFFRHYRIHTDVPLMSNLACPEIINKPFLGVPILLERRHPKIVL